MSAANSSFSFIERFRHWYEYEKDCNQKLLKMLDSVPQEKRSDPDFASAVGKMAHLITARHMWFYRLKLCTDRPSDWFPSTPLDQLLPWMTDVEDRWTNYLARLTDADIAAEFEWDGYDGKRRRWQLANLLTQIFGHAWYHRGQIAMLVKDLGGEPVDTDFIFWDRPTIIEKGPS